MCTVPSTLHITLWHCTFLSAQDKDGVIPLLHQGIKAWRWWVNITEVLIAFGRIQLLAMSSKYSWHFRARRGGFWESFLASKKKRQDDTRSTDRRQHAWQQHNTTFVPGPRPTQRSPRYSNSSTQSPNGSDHPEYSTESLTEVEYPQDDPYDQTYHKGERHNSYSHSPDASRYDDHPQEPQSERPRSEDSSSDSQSSYTSDSQSSNNQAREEEPPGIDRSSVPPKWSIRIDSRKAQDLARAYWLMVQLGVKGVEQLDAYRAVRDITRFESSHDIHEANASKEYCEAFDLLKRLTAATILIAKHSKYNVEKSLYALETLESVIWGKPISGDEEQVFFLPPNANFS